jgi:putative GTP pyrophosphokinase
MPSLDFDTEKSQFRDFYDANRQRLEDAKDSFVTLINALTNHAGTIAISKIEGRLKTKRSASKNLT